MSLNERCCISPPSSRDALHNHAFGTMRHQSSIRPKCSQATIDQWDDSSLEKKWKSVRVHCKTSCRSAAELTNTEYDLWCSVVSRAHDRAVIFIVESGRSKINQVDLRRKQHSPELGTSCCESGRRGYVAVVGEGLIRMTEQEDVFRLQIGVNEVEIVKECDGAEQLPSKGLDMRTREWNETAGFQKVEDTEAKKRRDDADVTAPVEAIAQLNTAIVVALIGGAQSLQHPKLDSRCVAILVMNQGQLKQANTSDLINTFGTARMTLTATSLRVSRLRARTTLPKVP